jgi:hypothetical protein
MDAKRPFATLRDRLIPVCGHAAAIPSQLRLLGISAALILCVVATSTVSADTAPLLSACKSNVTRGMLPPGMTGSGYMEFCDCLARKAADNQGVIDEFTAITSASPVEAQAKMAASSAAARAIGVACQNPLFPPQAQLALRVPFEPAAFPSLGRIYLTYELTVTNFATYPESIQRVDVMDASGSDHKTLATLADSALDAALQHFSNPVLGDQKPPAGPGYRQLAPGESAIVFLMIVLPGDARVPERLRHRVQTSDSAVEGALIGTHATELRTLGPPVAGGSWAVLAGPTNNDSYHRRGIIVLDGHPAISRRYAIDWKQLDRGGASFSGAADENRSYYAYGKPVVAVAAGSIVDVVDGLPENIPGHNGTGRRAVALSLQTIGGNSVTLDLGGGQFAHYYHLQTGSLLVHPGEHVKRGQLLARVGDSGDALEPHLHFEVTTSAKTMVGEGVPYVIDRWRVVPSGGAAPGERRRELPPDLSVVDFGG